MNPIQKDDGEEIVSSKNTDLIPLQSTTNNNNNTTNQQAKCSKYVGLLFCLAFTVSMAMTTTVVKLLHLPATEKVFVRCLTQFTLILPLITYNEHHNGYTIFVDDRRLYKLLIFRGLSSSAASLLLYHAFQRMPIGDVTAISFSSAIFAGLFARIFLNESYTIADGILAILSIGGVCLIAQPEFIFGGSNSQPSYAGVIFALCAAVMIGSSMTIIRACAQVHAWVGVFYYCTMGAFINGTVFYFEGNYALPCHSQLHLFFGIGFLGSTSQYFVTKSLQYERPSTVAVMRSIEIILVYISQIVLFEELPNIYNVIGASLIFLSTVGIGVRKYLKTNNSDTQQKTIKTSSD